MNVVDINGLDEMFILLDKGVKYEVPYYNISNKSGVTIRNFYFEDKNYVVVLSKDINYIVPYDIYSLNDKFLTNFSVEKDNDVFTVYADSKVYGHKHIEVYTSSDYMDCLKFISARMEKPLLSFQVVFDTGKEVTIKNLSDLYNYNGELEAVNLKVVYANRIEIQFNLVSTINDELVLNGDISHYKVLLQNEDIMQFLKDFTKEYDVKRVICTNSKNKSFLYIDVNKWFVGKYLFPNTSKNVEQKFKNKRSETR